MRVRGKLAGLIVIAGCLLVPRAGAAPIVTDLPLTPVGGDVTTAAISGDAAYLGGTFQGFGAPWGGLAATLPDTGELDQTWPRSPGAITAMLADGSGGVWVAGDMTVGGATQHGVFHVLADKTLDPAFAAPVTGTVRALRVVGSTLYIGGAFSEIAGSAAHPNLAAVDTASGALITAFDPDPDGAVDALAFASTLTIGQRELVIGGSFTHLGTTPRAQLGAVDPATGAALAFNPGPNGPVHALAVTKNGTNQMTIYAAGEFSSVGGDTAHKAVVALSYAGTPTSWAPTSIGPRLDLTRALALDGSRAYVQTASEGILGYRLSDGVADRTFAVNGTATALEVSGGTLYAAGELGAAPASPSSTELVNHAGFFAWSVADATVTGWGPTVDRDDAGPMVLAVSAGRVFTGGAFNVVATLHRRELAAVDLATGAFKPWRLDVLGEVKVLVPSAAGVYVAGTFEHLGGRDRLNIGEFTADATVTDWSPRIQGSIYAIDPAGDVVRVGGLNLLANVAGADFRARDSIAEFEAGTAIVRGFHAPGNTPAIALAHRGARVFSVRSGQVVGWDSTSPTEVGVADPLAVSVTGSARALLVDDARLLIGGDFTGLGPGAPRRGLGAVDLSTGAVDPLDAGLDGRVDALARLGSRYLAAGTFTVAGGAAHRGLVAIDRTTGAVDAWDPHLPGAVSAVAANADGGAVIVDAAGSARLIAFPPGAPVAPVASAGVESATVAFSPAASAGRPVTTYTVTASPGGAQATGTASPITVPGLRAGQAYTFTVTATNAAGEGDRSVPTAPVIPAAAAKEAQPGAAADHTAPVLSGLRLSARRFALARGTTAQAARLATPKGTTVRFSLSEPARVTLTIEQELAGRRRGKACVAPRGARGARCKRYVAAAALSRASVAAGQAKLPFTGRVGKRALRPGRYRLTVLATDPSGNRSAPATASFTVVRNTAR